MHCNGGMDVAWALFWEIVWAGNLVFFIVFPCQVAPAGDERYFGCAAVAARVVLTCDWFGTVGGVARCSVRVRACGIVG